MQYLLISLFSTFYNLCLNQFFWDYSNQVWILHFPPGRGDPFNLEENSNHPKVLRLRVSGFWPSSSWNTQLYNRLTSVVWQNNFKLRWFVSLDWDTCLTHRFVFVFLWDLWLLSMLSNVHPVSICICICVCVFTCFFICICVFVRLDVEYAEPCPSHLSAKRATFIMRKKMVMILKDNDDDDEVRKQIYLYIGHWSKILNFICIRREFSFYTVK